MSSTTTTTGAQINLENRIENVRKGLLRLDEMNGSELITTQCVRSLLHFLGDFFHDEEIEPDSPNKEKQLSALDRIYNYRHYRELFNVISEQIREIENDNSRMGMGIDRMIDEFRDIADQYKQERAS